MRGLLFLKSPFFEISLSLTASSSSEEKVFDDSMSLKEIGEFGLIKRITRGGLIRKSGVIKAIGDDAAVFRIDPGEVILATTDLLVERVHFLRDRISGRDLGYKSLAVNLSDIAAMGGRAREAFISIGIPDDCGIDYIEDFYDGMRVLAAEHEVNLLGGDTTGSKKDLIINLLVTGSAKEGEILYRRGAQPGDLIFTTGFLGDSRAGLYLIVNSIEYEDEKMQALVNAHNRPKAYLREGRFLAQQPGVHAAIDTSDGLTSDLGHIMEESGVGVRIHAEKIPISENLYAFCSRYKFDPLSCAISGGEDYTLLCTVSPERADKVALDYRKRFKHPLYALGEITDTKRMEILRADGRIETIRASGWDHFHQEE